MKLFWNVLFIAILAASQVYVIHQVKGGSATEEITATVTAYTNRQCETNSDPGHTATMEDPVAGWTCAVSRDLMHWLGGRVYIDGVGVRRVNDLMNKRFQERVDVFMGTVEEARAFGNQTREVMFLGR